MIATLTREAAVAALDAEIARRSSVDFVAHLSIRSDDPLDTTLSKVNLWPFQVEELLALETGESQVILKERQLGFTTVVMGPYMLWRAMFFGWSVGYYSVDQPAARTQIARLKQMWSLLPPHLRVGAQWTADDVHFAGGGVIRAFPSTDHAGISYTFNLVVMDEAAFHPYGAQNYAAFSPAVARGQVVIQSTADPSIGPSGFFFDIYWASKRGETGYRAIFEARRRPDRTPEWYAMMRARYTGRLDEFDAYYPETDAAAFVGRSGLVYPMFDATKHVKPDPFSWVEAKYRVAGVDFGGGDPTAVILLGVSGTGHVHQFAEMYERGPVDSQQIARFLMEWEAKAPLLAVACDPSQGTAIRDIAAFGVRQGVELPAIPADNAREGIGVLAGYLERGQFSINPGCAGSLSEFPGYRWVQRTDPNDRVRYETSTPGWNHADAMDGRRYGLMIIDHIEQSRREARQSPEDRRAKLRQVYGVAEPVPTGSQSRRVAG